MFAVWAGLGVVGRRGGEEQERREGDAQDLLAGSVDQPSHAPGTPVLPRSSYLERERERKREMKADVLHLHGQHDIATYEVRTKEGYGARWTISKEGAVEFRGFIEPVRTPLPRHYVESIGVHEPGQLTPARDGDVCAANGRWPRQEVAPLGQGAPRPDPLTSWERRRYRLGAHN